MKTFIVEKSFHVKFDNFLNLLGSFSYRIFLFFNLFILLIHILLLPTESSQNLSQCILIRLVVYFFSLCSHGTSILVLLYTEQFKGNAQFIFLCNPQKSLVNVFLMRNIQKHCHKKVIVRFFITQVKKTFKSSSCGNISNFHNGFV